MPGKHLPIPIDIIQLYSIDWYPISNGYYVAQEGGNKVDDPTLHMTLEDCQRKCDKNRLCNSIAWCPEHNDRCYLKDKKLTKATPTRYHGYCTSYYKHYPGHIIF